MTNLDKANRKFRLKEEEENRRTTKAKSKKSGNKGKGWGSRWRRTTLGIKRSKGVCDDKTKYETEKEALLMGKQYKQYIYSCLKCSKWHLSSSSKNR